MNKRTASTDRAPARVVSLKEPELAGLISAVLRFGVWTAATIVALGYAALIRNGLPVRHFRHFTGTVVPGRHGILDVLLAMRDRHSADDFVVLGIVVLILTPVVRVAMSWVVFLYERDRLYAWLTAVVFAILVLSLLGVTV